MLYWVQMHTEAGKPLSSDDGFRSTQDNTDLYVVWEPNNSHTQNTWFLHGALHIFDSGTEIQKYTWKRTNIRLIDQIREALNKGYFPLFVSEGSSKEKYERIRHSDYLAKAYRSFSSIQGPLFIFGHSLDPNDDHYLNCIAHGKISHLYVGIHGDPESESNQALISRANSLANARGSKNKLSIVFFNAASANVWRKENVF